MQCHGDVSGVLVTFVKCFVRFRVVWRSCFHLEFTLVKNQIKSRSLAGIITQMTPPLLPCFESRVRPFELSV